MNAHFEVKIGSDTRDILMSFGLLSTLCNIVVDPARCPLITIDPILRSEVLSELLAVRKKSGKIITPVEDVDDIDMSVEDAEGLLNWAAEHVLSFFVRNLKRSNDLLNQHKGTLEALQSSVTGSANSVSSTA